jgi:hypothetical protein
MCPHLFHRIPWAIQDKVRQAFCLPLDWIARDLMDELTWFLFPFIAPLVFALYLRRSFKSMKGFCLLQGIYGGQLFFFKKEFSCASCAPCFHHSWEDFSITLRRVSEYICVPRILQPMMPTIRSKDTVVVLHHIYSLPLYLVPPPIFYY